MVRAGGHNRLWAENCRDCRFAESFGRVKVKGRYDLDVSRQISHFNAEGYLHL